MFKWEINDNALDDLRFLKKFEQVLIFEAIDRQLAFEPDVPTRNRKPLRPNTLSQWELRIERYRVFYDVDQEHQVVIVKAVGWKDHNILRIRGKEFTL